MSYERRPIRAVNPWLVRSLPNRKQLIAGATLHITASGKAEGDDGPRTEGWWSNPQNDKGGWGSVADWLIYEDGTQVYVTDTDREYGAWTAGFGEDPETWALGIRFVQIELAKGTVAEPWNPAQIDSAAQLVAELSKRYSFPLVRVEYEDQVGEPIPGINTHAGSANGRAYGKVDPGDNFPWDTFLAKARAYAGEEDEMSEELRERVARLERLFTWRAAEEGPMTPEYVEAEMERLDREVNANVITYMGNVDRELDDLLERFDVHLNNHAAGAVFDHIHETGGPIIENEEG